MNTHEKNNAIAWIGVVIGSMALLLALYNTFAKEPAENQLRNNIVETTTTDQRIINDDNQATIENMANTTMARLEEISENIDPNDSQTLQAAGAEVNDLRTELNQLYSNLEGEAQESWQMLDDDLANIGRQLEQGSVDAIENIQIMLENLQQDIAEE